MACKINGFLLLTEILIIEKICAASKLKSREFSDPPDPDFKNVARFWILLGAP